MVEIALCEKCPITEFFLVRIFPHAVKYGPEKTPYLDTFHTMYVIHILSIFFNVLDSVSREFEMK